MWKTSSYCSADKPSCVQVASQGDMVLVRDSKDSDSPVLKFTPQEWAAFTAGTRDGEFAVEKLTKLPSSIKF